MSDHPPRLVVEFLSLFPEPGWLEEGAVPERLRPAQALSEGWRPPLVERVPATGTLLSRYRRQRIDRLVSGLANGSNPELDPDLLNPPYLLMLTAEGRHLRLLHRLRADEAAGEADTAQPPSPPVTPAPTAAQPGSERRRTAPAADQLPPRPERPVTSWQDVAKRLESLRDQGIHYLDQVKLAKWLGCSQSTISKAIRSTPGLSAWGRTRGPVSCREQVLNGQVLENVEQDRETLPVDQVRIREYLERTDLTPDARALFNALPSDEEKVRRLDQIEALKAEQAADQRRDERRPRRKSADAT
jgi:hypothetical protein